MSDWSMVRDKAVTMEAWEELPVSNCYHRLSVSLCPRLLDELTEL